MRFAIIASVLAAMASAASVDLEKRNSPLDLHLEASGHEVKATLTNKGNEDLKVLKLGTILDEEAPVQKISVFSNNKKIDHTGVHLRIATHDLPESAFEVIPAGKSITRKIDAARVHDLSSGGKFEFKSSGYLPVASMNGTTIEDAMPFSSNMASSAVDGRLAAASNINNVFDKRFKVVECSGNTQAATASAINKCAKIANNAASIASHDSARVSDYFKSPSAKEHVVRIFKKVAENCGSTSNGLPYHCRDVINACREGVLAYTLPSKSFMVNCPLFFKQEPINKRCHGQDQATTILHEATHLREVKGTDDYGVYGYSAVKRLSAQQNLNHADTYSLFAQSIYADNCNSR